MRTILAIDDSQLTHQMFKVFLVRYADCRLLSVLSAEEALETLSREPVVDMILLDVNMPQMNGVEFLERLLEHPAHRAVPVLVISGSEAQKANLLRMGARGFLKKPFQADEFRAAVDKVLASGK